MNLDISNDWLAQLFRLPNRPRTFSAAFAGRQRIEVLTRGEPVLRFVHEMMLNKPDYPLVCLVNGSVPAAEFDALDGLVRRAPAEIVFVAAMRRFDPQRIKVLYDGGIRCFVGSTASLDVVGAALDAPVGAGAFFTSDLLGEWIDGDRDTLRGRNSFRLTRREMEVMKLLSRKMSSKEIAESLDVSVRTVESHRLNIRRKLGTAHYESAILSMGNDQRPFFGK